MKQNNTSRHVRLIAALLLIVTVFGLVLTACKTSDGGNSSTTTKTTTATGGDNTPTDSNRQLVESLYGDYNYNGYDFKILGMASGSWWYGSFLGDTFNEIWYETDSADPLESAIYTRNRRTEDLLNITISPVWTQNAGETVEKVRKAIETGETDYDLCLGCLSETMNCAQEGYMANILDVETIDVTHPWWDQNLVDAYTIFNDRLYLLSGHANVYDDMSILFFLFNKDMAEQYGIGDLYHYVDENNWTIDTIVELSKKTFHDNGDGNSASNVYTLNQSGGLFHGFNLPMTEPDEDGIPQLTVTREEHVNAAAKLYNTVIEGEFYRPSGMDEQDADLFANNQMFLYSVITCQLNRYRNLQIDFGLMPFPKLNSQQSKYSHFVNWAFFSCYFIPTFNQELDRTGVIFETMSGYSTETVYNTTFETLMGYDSKLLRDNRSKDMLDIIMNSRQFDYSIMGLGDIGKIYTMDTWGSFMYESVVDTYKRSAMTALKKIVRNFESIE